MKKVVFILLCSLFCFSFTTKEKLTQENQPSSESPCVQGTISLTFLQDCDGDGETDITYTATICREHIRAMSEFVESIC